ncbi:hypothetical protein ES703_31691 [subsurface metagenome]
MVVAEAEPEIKFKKTLAQKKAVKMLSGSATHNMLDGGSRSGKTYILVRSILIRMTKAANSRHCILRKHFNAVKKSIWHDTLPKVIYNEFSDVPFEYNRSDMFIRIPQNGAELWLGGLDNKERADRILGNEYSTVYFNEASEFSWDSVTTAHTRLAQNVGLVNKCYYDCNPPSKRHWLHKVFKEHIDPETNTPLDSDQWLSMLINPFDNLENLPPGYIEQILDKLPRRKKLRFKDGIWQDDSEGGLWDRQDIDDNRVQTHPPLNRVVIGVDPAVSSTRTSDSTGIVLGGKVKGSRCFVLEDRTIRGTPYEWGKEVVDLYHEYQADLVVGEVNNGGDLVEANIKNIDSTVNFKAVHASRGKITRAEPIEALYEQNIVHHVGEFPELEDEQCNWNPEVDDKSPDRMDALVWMLWELTQHNRNIGVW